MIHEYVELLGDGAHWLFEITLMVVFDVVLLGIAWPFVKKAIKRHDRSAHQGHTTEGAVREIKQPVDLARAFMPDARGYIERDGTFAHHHLPLPGFVVMKGRASYRVEVTPHLHSVPPNSTRSQQTNATQGHTHEIAAYEHNHGEAPSWTLSGEPASNHG